jgi:hypothetical protein
MKLFFIYKKVQFEWKALIENFFFKKKTSKIDTKKIVWLKNWDYL